MLAKEINKKADAKIRQQKQRQSISHTVDGTGLETKPIGEILTTAVESINTLTGDVTLAEGDNITIEVAGNIITINSSGGGGSGIFDFGLITESASSSQDWGNLV